MESSNTIAAHESQPIVTSDGPMLRPLGVTVVGVLSILGGALGFMSSFSVIIQTVAAPFISDLFSQGGPFQGSQAAMQKEMFDVVSRYAIPNCLIAVAGMVLTAMMVTGGGGLFMRKPWSRQLLRRTFLFMIIWEFVRLILNGFMQVEIIPINQAYFQSTAAGPGGGEAMAQFASIMTYVGLVFYVVWVLVKLGLLTWGRKYLAKPHLDGYWNSPQRS
ncbi:hypothetical protein CA13_36600 [Planctomycetes bacterium CA13]|uniref:Uncharacterized protein n=1 Tax=Novipirellula herctigrandis TaxID=2527986 RepID=A0A5C5Z492_9BACT|nr:hypothetical protein CA13_36600 [Planctomycetes bacterium CA13]